MDFIDLQIAKKLLINCRITYRELADIFDLSVNAVYKRVQNMMNDGLIRAFTAKPSLVALNGIQILICGISKGQNLNTISKDLGEHDSIYFVGNAGGNYLYIDACLRNLSEMHEFTIFTSNTGKLENPTALVKKLPYRITPESLTLLDYKILKFLKEDARKSLTDLADEVGISTKTARKRIKRMIEYNLVDFSINFAPQAEGIIVSQFHLYLKDGIDYNSAFERINKDYVENILYLQQFNNVPNLLMVTALTKSNKETADLYDRFQNEPLKNLEYHIIYNGFFFETWREKLYRDMINKVKILRLQF